MSLNWKEIDLVLSELPLEGSRIQKVRQPDFSTLLLELYHPRDGRYSLLVCMAQKACRVHRLYTERPKHQDVKKTQRFVQLLRSHIERGLISQAVHIHSDRIIRLSISCSRADYYLYIRLWDGSANILLCAADHVILDAFYRRPAKDEQSGSRFAPEEREAPEVKTAFEIRPREEGISFNEQIDREYRLKGLKELEDKLISRAESLLSGKESRLMKRLQGMQRQEELQDGGRTKEIADLLSANIHRIRPGESSVTVEDFYHGNEQVDIPLDPKLSPGEQAEAYYRQYQKEKRAREHRDEELKNLRRQLEDITEQRRKLLHPWKDTEGHIQALKNFISSEAGTEGKREEGKHIPGLQFRSGQFIILVGRTAKENDQLLRRFTRGNDTWVHARDYPGGYVFIKHLKGKSIPLETLLDAGNLAIHFSKARRSGKGDVYVTQVKYLRRAKHGKLGTVIPTQEKNLHVEIEPKRLERLLGGA